MQEALVRGIPVITSNRSGIAERFEGELRELLCDHPDAPEELVGNLLKWRARLSHWRGPAARLGESLREQSWTSMAEEIVDLIENGQHAREHTTLSVASVGN
jgi:glycosyltransferase involved in cell wall biosynthesis